MPLNKTFAVERWVDLEFGNNSSAGTRAAPWLTLQKVVDTDFTPAANSAPVSVLVHVAGSSGGSNSFCPGWDQFTFDAQARTSPVTEIGFVAWTEADGARPGGAAIVRPVLRADTPFPSAALTQVNAGVVWKSNALSGFSTSGTNAISGVSQVLFRPGVAAQLDADGAWRCHLKIIGNTADTDTNIANALIAAGANTAWYNPSTRVIFVNTTGLSTSGADYSWCPSQTVENFAKIRPIQFSYVGIENIDFAFGERGPAIFDARTARVLNCRVYEMQVHGIICSYTNYALQDIRIEGCEIYGLGQSTTGQSLLAMAGSSGNFDQIDCKIINCKVRRYMLQNPSGINYNRTFSGTWANRAYATYPLGIGTADSASAGTVRDVEIIGSTFEDVSPAKTSTTDAGLCIGARHAIPANRDQFGTYPIRFINCNIRTFGTWCDRSVGSNEGSHSFGFWNCRILAASPDATAYPWGVRTAIVFATPVQAGATINYGFFGGTELTIDVGLADAGNNFAGIGVQDVSLTGRGLRDYLTMRNSTYTLVTKGPQVYPMFDQCGDTTAANKILVIDVQNSELASVGPIPLALNAGQLAQRDLPAANNTARVFRNNTYVGFNQGSFTASNTTWASFLTNVDPQGRLASEQQYQAPDLAPQASLIAASLRM